MKEKEIKTDFPWVTGGKKGKWKAFIWVCHQP